MDWGLSLGLACPHASKLLSFVYQIKLWEAVTECNTGQLFLVFVWWETEPRKLHTHPTIQETAPTRQWGRYYEFNEEFSEEFNEESISKSSMRVKEEFSAISTLFWKKWRGADVIMRIQCFSRYEMPRLVTMKSVPANIYLRPVPPGSLKHRVPNSTVNSLSGYLKVAVAVAQGSKICQGSKDGRALGFSPWQCSWQVLVCSWQYDWFMSLEIIRLSL